MYPSEIVFGLTAYELAILVGFLSALLYFRVMGDKMHLSAGLQNLVIVAGTLATVVGYYASVLVQALWNALKDGHFELSANTGATFYGGLVGGLVCFFALYFLLGCTLFKKAEAGKNLYYVLNVGIPCIPLAHGFGRIGCLFAGCCHGEITDAWYGVWNEYLDAKTVPTQLMETIFLFSLTAILTVLTFKKKKSNPQIYLCAYGVFRFFMEYLRADDRGASFISFLTPSQLVAVALVLTGGIWFAWRKYREK